MVIPGDWSSLALGLRRAGLGEAEISALEVALQEDDNALGTATRAWQDAISEGVRTGSVHFAGGVTIGVITDIVAKFLGVG